MRHDDDSRNEPVNLGPGTIVRETAKAILVLFRDGTERWIPQSVVHDDSPTWKLTHDGDVLVKRWWAESEALS